MQRQYRSRDGGADSVSVALLTVYDMCKAVDKSMIITNIELLSKSKEEIK